MLCAAAFSPVCLRKTALARSAVEVVSARWGNRGKKNGYGGLRRAKREGLMDEYAPDVAAIRELGAPDVSGRSYFHFFFFYECGAPRRRPFSPARRSSD